MILSSIRLANWRTWIPEPDDLTIYLLHELNRLLPLRFGRLHLVHSEYNELDRVFIPGQHFAARLAHRVYTCL